VIACAGSDLITRPDYTGMAFNLKKVLKALLLSTNQPLATKDIQAAFTRFHEQASSFAAMETTEEAPTAAVPAAESVPAENVALTDNPEVPSNPDAPPPAVATPGAEEPTEIVLETAVDPELYGDVPSLVTATQIREAMDQIAAELRANDDGLLLIEGNNGYRIVTHPRFGRWIRILRQEPPPVKLSQSAVETLAVIAYRQPVTRGEIETIRGVSAEAGITKLLERELIYVVGRADAPGRPIQYGTTDQFLEFVGIKSLDELPASDVLSSRQIDEWLKNSDSAHRPDDRDMGLPDEQLPLESAGNAEPASETPAEPESPAPAADSNPPA
jgi:segregation and condensation protein B